MDLSLRKSIDEDIIVDSAEDEKENRHSADNIFPSPDHEDIICAPSIPLMLSTSSTCSSPSPAPPSPSLSTSPHSMGIKRFSSSDVKKQRNELNSNSPSPKSTGQKSPRRTPNGLVSNSGKHQKCDDRKKIDSTLHPKLETNTTNLNLSNLLLAAAAHSQQLDSLQPSDLQPMTFPSELLPHIAAAARISAGKQGKTLQSLQGMLPGAANIPLLLPQLTGNSRATTPDLLNPASILPLYPDMALRLVAAASSDLQGTPPPPQVLVKQGVSKCQECNIVFCKHENYLAHKKHYCSARQVSEPTPVLEETVGHKSISPAVPNSPPSNSSPPPPPPVPIKERSSVNSHSNQIVPSGSKTPLYQFICAACGIKFTSYDNLTAHQTHYCPKRPALEPEKSSRKCPKCKVSIAFYLL